MKREKDDPPKESEKDKLMSVLEILELQARARAIKSQLLLETQAKKQAAEHEGPTQVEDGSDSDVLIEEVGDTEEIVITSESETETNTSSSEKVGESVEEKKNRLEKRIQKRIRLKGNTPNNNKKSDPETSTTDVPNILEGTEDGTIDQYNRLLSLNDKNGTTSEAAQENGKQDAPDNQGNLKNKDSSLTSNGKMEENENKQKEATETSTEKDITFVEKAEEGEIIEYQEDSINKAEEGDVFNKSVRKDTSSDKDADTNKPEKEANPEVSAETNDGDCAIIINLDDDEIDEMNNA